MSAHRPRVLLAGGGTGGHVAPGVAILEALRARCPETVALFAGTGRPVERRILDAARIDGVVLPAAASPRLLALPRFGLTCWRALRAARAVVRDFAPDVVVALGGYGSVFSGLAARTLGVPLVVMEQNAVPGRAVRLLARIATRVHVPPVAGIAARFPRRAVLVETGNPIRAAALVEGEPRSSETVARARRALGLSPDPRGRVLLGIGGSQGAARLNRFVISAAPAIARAVRDAHGEGRFSVLHLAGTPAEARACRDALAARDVPAVVMSFIDRPGLAYAAADVALTRAGAGALAEIAAAALPAVVVALPGSARGHQEANAAAHAAAGAGLDVAERDLGGDVARRMGALLADRGALERVSDAARAIGRPGASADVAASLIAVIEQRERAGAVAPEEASAAWRTVRSSA